jgi:hypothetical protein
MASSSSRIDEGEATAAGTESSQDEWRKAPKACKQDGEAKTSFRARGSLLG